MAESPPFDDLSQARPLTEKVLTRLRRLLHGEAVSGVMLLVATAAALIWANSPFAHGYHAFWNVPFAVGFGDHVFSRSLHFWVNDVLMTIFFLVVGVEIRREVHEGSLSRFDQAILPMIAAIGGVVIPALIYLSLNSDPAHRQGWAVPTATDIAFAVGVLALLGRRIPVNVRVFLLTLATVDDVIGVLIIAVFYTPDLQLGGFGLASIGILAAIGLRRISIGFALLYVTSGVLIWIGFLIAGIHPALAGVVLAFMTPARARAMREPLLESASRAIAHLQSGGVAEASDLQLLQQHLRDLRVAHREILSPVSRVQMAMRPWVAYGVMPIFALTNAGVSLNGAELAADGRPLMTSIALALVVGKPVGVVGATWLAVRTGWCRLAPGISPGGVCLIGLLAGVGFTMSFFTSMLAFSGQELLQAAKQGVLLGSSIAATLGLAWGIVYVRRQ
ncbi:Na+/H+ antiporter NhaA [Bradyrhizobium oligotrophicum]|uniref:Na+/H+ antiporter NhaA n=1 Tax=Bradyrhizobium oligotrophicum TaxID=44255 RepID=UPI003EB69839